MSLDAPAQTPLDGSQFTLGIVAARFNGELVDGLLQGLADTWAQHGVPADRIELRRVPGSHEVPVAVQWLADTGRFDCVVALGVLIGGETNHHQLVGTSVSHALQAIALASRIPVINGVIVADTRAQAEARCTGAINRGVEFARAALEMAALRRKFKS